MPREDRTDQVQHQGAAPIDPEAHVPQAQPERQEDRELSDKELEKVSGGVWRLGKWFPY